MIQQLCDNNYLVKIEHQIQLADIAEVMVQNLHKQVDRLEIRQLVVSHVNTHAEVKPSIPPVDDLVRFELRKYSQIFS